MKGGAKKVLRNEFFFFFFFFGNIEVRASLRVSRLISQVLKLTTM
jgi:hypothetical protein